MKTNKADTDIRGNKMSKSKRLIELRKLLESYKKIDHEPEVTELAKYLDCTRQTLYYDEDYRKLLEEFEVGKKNKKRTIASQEYLLERIDKLNKEAMVKENKIKKLNTRIANLEKDVQSLDEDLAKEKRTTLRLQIYYLHLIETYNKISNKPIVIEPYDMHNLEADPLDIFRRNEDNIKANNIIPIKNKID